jgi:hypothetical protein
MIGKVDAEESGGLDNYGEDRVMSNAIMFGNQTFFEFLLIRRLFGFASLPHDRFAFVGSISKDQCCNCSMLIKRFQTSEVNRFCQEKRSIFCFYATIFRGRN